MDETKKNGRFNNLKRGFTIIELLVVIFIMAMLAGLFLVNLAGQRVSRNIQIAQNQLVSNIRKIQSYTLSSRNVSLNQPAEYYLMKFDLNKPFQYTIQAIYKAGTTPMLRDVEVVKFPTGIRLATVTPVQILRMAPLSQQNPAYNNGCALLAFATPFARIIFNNGCGITSPPVVDINPGTIDDYGRVVNFSINSETYSASTDSVMTITLSDVDNTLTKVIKINGITGLISVP